MIADEQRQRNVRPIIETVDRRNDDLEGRDGPGRNEIAASSAPLNVPIRQFPDMSLPPGSAAGLKAADRGAT